MQHRDWQSTIRLLEARRKKAREVLGVSDSAGPAEIKAAWRRKSIRHHPDKNEGTPESHRRFILVNFAYRCLILGEGCDALDSANPSGRAPDHPKYRLDNRWGYFAWWRENYFE
jgi:DnaJ-class molecular chaperone